MRKSNVAVIGFGRLGRACALVLQDLDGLRPRRRRSQVSLAHGSGSSRHSARNRAVAQTFQSHRLATLLMDLLAVE